MSNKIISILILYSLVIIACSNPMKKTEIHYSITSDSTAYYYKKGWEEIMDQGDYAKAEKSYRKALSFDSEFLIGQSVLARLTLDLEERLILYKNIEKHKERLIGDEKLILEVYLALVEYTNLRDQKAINIEEVLREALTVGENNLRKIVNKYPQEVYLKSEYIEILHANYGAKRALDSLHKLILPTQIENPFLLGYEATMEAELGHFDKALKKAKILNKIYKEKKVAKPVVTLGDIYFKKGDLDSARLYANKAMKIDHRNLDASRLQAKIEQAIKNRDSLKVSY